MIAPAKPPIINGYKYDFLTNGLEVIAIITDEIKFNINTTGTTSLMSKNNNIKGTIIKDEPKPIKPNTIKEKNTIMLDKITVKINMLYL